MRGRQMRELMMVRIVQPFAVTRHMFSESQPSGSVEVMRTRAGHNEIAREQIRILAIDDDPDILETIAESLTEPRFRSQTTSSSEALSTLLDKFDPDIIVTDLRMPARDGIDVLRILRDRKFQGSVVLMSGSDHQIMDAARQIADSYGLAISGVLHKPFSRDELMALIAGNGLDCALENEQAATSLSQRRMCPYYLPTVDLKTGSIVSADVIFRWRHPERGLITLRGTSGGKRPAAKQSLHDFANLEWALQFGARLHGLGKRIKIAVNLGADVILTDEFLTILTDAQNRYGLPPEQLVIGLTEQDFAGNYDKLSECLLKVRLYGVHVALDDFGIGHSAFSCIQKLPLNEIRIDRTFLTGSHEPSRNAAIMRSIVQLAHSVGISVVAKGVESAETIEPLQKIGCDMAQGDIFSPAINEATFIALTHDDNFSFLSKE